MNHLVIKNVGPIKDINIELKRFNFIIGPQSSGKSTIAKIFSTCQWIEKEVATTYDEKSVDSAESFRNLVENFHKMNGYFKKDSYINYETDVITIHYEVENFFIKLKDKTLYRRLKICYIPSERNMITLPELQSLELKQTNLRSFLFDLFSAREYFDTSNKTEILNLGVKYYYDKDETTYKDRIEHITGELYKIPLYSASSGLQSIVPLLLILQYYTEQYYIDYNSKTSFEFDDKKRKLGSKLVREYIIDRIKRDSSDRDILKLIEQFNKGLNTGNHEYMQWYEEYIRELNRLTVPYRTKFIIEEPEQNLYPSTQLGLIESLVSLCNDEKKHGFTITTHSPYIISFLNILILRHYKNINGKANIDPNCLAVFAVQDGGCYDLIQENKSTGYFSVNTDDLTEAMQDLFSEYIELKKL